MATVKSIDVALRATTTEFESGFSKSTKTMNSFDASASRVAARMGKTASLFQAGAISQAEYTQTIKACDKELSAISSGFGSYSSALARTDSIMKSLETDTERFQNSLRELQQLRKLGTMSEEQYAAAVKKTTAAYHASIPTAQMAGTAGDKFGLQYASSIPIIGRFSGMMAGMATPVGAAAAALVGAGVAVAGAATAFRFLSDVVQTGLVRLEAAAESADRLGMMTAEFQKLEYAGELAGVSTEELSADLTKMGRTISEAMSGNKSAAAAFDQLGVSASSLSTMTADQAFKRLATAISEVQSPFDRARLTMEVFGKGGAKLATVMEGGAAGIEELGKRAEQLRIPITQADAANVKAAADAITDLSKAFEGLGNVITTQVAPVLKPVLDDLTNTVIDPGDSVQRMASHWKEAGQEILKSNGIFDAATRLNRLYFNSVNEAAALADKTNTSAVTTTPVAKFDPAEIQSYMSTVEEAAKRQEQISKRAIDAQKQLRSEQLETAQEHLRSLSTLDSGLFTGGEVSPAVAKMDPIRVPIEPLNPIKIPVHPLQPVSIEFAPKMQPIEQAQAKLAQLAEQSKQSSAALVVSQNALLVPQNKVIANQEAFTSSLHLSSQEFLKQRTAIEARNKLITDASSHLSAAANIQRALTAAISPAITGQQEYLRKVQEINVAYANQQISIQKRNELLSQAEIQAAPSFGGLPNVKPVAASIMPQLGTMPNIPAMKIPVNFDQQPLKTFEATVEQLAAKLKAGEIDKGFFTQSVADAKSRMDSSLDMLEQIRTKQADNAKAAADAEKSLHVSRIADLRELLSAQHAAWAKANPALAIQEEFSAKVEKVNELFRSGLIPLGKRNELLTFAANTAKGEAMEEAKRRTEEASKPFEEMKARGAEISKSFESPFKTFERKVADLQNLKNVGAIDSTTMASAVMEARKEAMAEIGKMPEFMAANEIKGPAALEAGTNAAMSAFRENGRNARESDKNKEVAETLKKIEKHVARTAKGGVILKPAKL